MLSRELWHPNITETAVMVYGAEELILEVV